MPSTAWELTTFMSKLKQAYVWTNLATDSNYKDITTINTSNTAELSKILWWMTNNVFQWIVLPELIWWQVLDPNCDIDDITIWTQTWAWCNSTLWTWIDYNAGPCYNYQWTNIWWTSCYWYNTKENVYNATYGVNNIWWKLYTWPNSPTACPTWRHVPSDAELTTLENYLNWSQPPSPCRTWDWWQCDWLWWGGHTSKNDTNNLVNALKLPLAGRRNTDGVTFYGRGYDTYLWSSTPSAGTAYYRGLGWYNSTVNRNANSQSYGFSVRCIKD